MSKLTKDTRERMARAIVKHAYGKRAEALVAKHTALFDRVYDFNYSGEVRKAMDALLKLEPNALPKRRSLTANVGMSIEIGTAMMFIPHMCGCLAEEKKVRHVPVFANHDGWHYKVVITDGDKRDPKLHEDIRQYADEYTALKDECERAYAEAFAALSGFSTVKRLREGWPEVLPLIEDMLPSGERAGLPAVQVNKLNDKFGLPPEQEAA